MKVAIIGTVGVPACYGGFETLVENLLEYRSNPEIEYTVFCSSKRYPEKMKEYKGAKLRYLPLDANGKMAPLYDMISLLLSLREYDVILSLGASCSPLLSLVRPFWKKTVILNIDGVDTKRGKVKGLTKVLLNLIRKLGAKFSTICVADNQGIVDIVKKEYGRDATLIEYGGDNAFSVEENGMLHGKYGIVKGNYSFKVARIEPENNIELILSAYAEIPEETLIIVGNWQRSEFGREMRSRYEGFKNIRMLDPIYDPKELNLLRSNSKLYVHGHSVGGTNPSLVEAMNLGLPILAYDVVFNRATTEGQALYFSTKEDLIKLVRSVSANTDQLSSLSKEMFEIAQRRYTWKIIAKKYENLYH